MTGGRWTQDALTYGARLREQEAMDRPKRIDAAITEGSPFPVPYITQSVRSKLAEKLYHARYPKNVVRSLEVASHEAVLDTFCDRIFGCSFEEVMEAWDRELG